MAKNKDLNTAEEVELEFRRLQVRKMQREMQAEEEQEARQNAERLRRLDDFQRNERMRQRQQEICKHRKGGRDNKFAKGTDANYSINVNTYPTGEMCISCTRCGKEVWKPKPELKKSDPKLYAQMWAEWQKWMEYPTDNSPSGSKIYEVVKDAA